MHILMRFLHDTVKFGLIQRYKIYTYCAMLLRGKADQIDLLILKRLRKKYLQ